MDVIDSYSSFSHESGCVVEACVCTNRIPDGTLVPQPLVDEWRLDTNAGHLFCIDLVRSSGRFVSALNLTYPVPVGLHGVALRERGGGRLRGIPSFAIDPRRGLKFREATTAFARRIFAVDLEYVMSITGAGTIVVEFGSPPLTVVEAGDDISLGIDGDGFLVAVEFTSPAEATIEAFKKFRR